MYSDPNSTILSRMLANVPSDVDKSEGSLILSPAVPTITAGLVGLAMYQIAVPARATTIINAGLTDVRVVSLVNGVPTQTSFTSHLADYVRQPGYAVDTGIANHLIVTLSPAPTSYANGMGVAVKSRSLETGSQT